MSHLAADGSVVFEAPTSTLEFGSLERGQYAVPLRWPGQHSCFNCPLDQLARRWYEKDRLEFFCLREILFHGKERGLPLRAASLDYCFGVRFLWPYPARRGERYVFTFLGEAPPDPPGRDMAVNDLELPDVVLINGRQRWERGFGESLYFTVEYVAAEDGPLTVTLVKDRCRCMADGFRGWTWKRALVHAICRGYIHLHLGLSLACEHYGPTDQAPTTGPEYALPASLRWFRNPGPWQWVPDEEVPAPPGPPLVLPDYPTDGVIYNQFHDLYLDAPDAGPRRAGLWGNAAALRDLVRLSLANGIRCFPQTEPVLQALEAEGLAADPTIVIFFSGGYIKRLRGSEFDTVERQRAARQDEGERLAAVMRRFPRSRVIYRLNEFSGCQYHHVVQCPEDRARSFPKPWYEFAQAADAINREALDEVLAPARALAPERLTVAANVQTIHLGAHPLHCGADFVLAKTIGRGQVNLVIAHSRGTNRAFGRWIGLQHDAWGGLNYNRDSPREVEAIHRSFFFNGGQFHDAEFGSVAVTAEGRGVFNRKGLAWTRVTRFAALHPRRGTPRVNLGFLTGSDQIWDWFYPGKHQFGLRDFNGYDPADPKEYVDFDLLAVAFPHFGRWFSPNPQRWLTGTPYGPCDLVPWDAPLPALQRYRVLPMLGAHRWEPAWWRNAVEYVCGGGVLVLALYQLLAPTRDRAYVKTDVSDLLGVRLGEDVPWWPEFNTLFDRQFFVSQHYNRVQLAGAEVVERLPNGDPLLTRFNLGVGQAWFFTTDRLQTIPGVAARLLRQLFTPHVPVTLNPPHDWMEITVSAKGDLRLIALLDHGRDRLPTDLGEDTGPYVGEVTLDLANLGLRDAEYEVLAVTTDDAITSLVVQPLAATRDGRFLRVPVAGLGSWLELVVGPVGQTRQAFFWT